MQIEKNSGKPTISPSSEKNQQAVQAVAETVLAMRHRPVFTTKPRPAKVSKDKDRRGQAEDRRQRKQRNAKRAVLLDTRSRHDRRQDLRRAKQARTIAPGAKDQHVSEVAAAHLVHGIDTKA